MGIGTGAAIIGGSIVSGLLGSKAASKSAKAQSRAAAQGSEALQAGQQLGIEEQRRQFDLTRRDLQRAQQQNVQALKFGQQQQTAQLTPFSEAGVESLNRQRALLGFGGEEQQQAAFAAFGNSPGQQFLRERAQKNLLRNAASIGGVGGGRVRSALVEQGAGFAAQDFANEFGRLQNLTSGGQAAASEIGRGELITAGARGSGAINTAARTGQFGAQSASNISNLLQGQGEAARFGLQQAGQARATGILGRNQAFQSAFGGALTGASQAGFFDANRGFTLPAANTDPFSRAA